MRDRYLWIEFAVRNKLAYVKDGGEQDDGGVLVCRQIVYKIEKVKCLCSVLFILEVVLGSFRETFIGGHEVFIHLPFCFWICLCFPRVQAFTVRRASTNLSEA